MPDPKSTEKEVLLALLRYLVNLHWRSQLSDPFRTDVRVPGTYYRVQLFFHVSLSPSIPRNLHGGPIKLGLSLSQENPLVPPSASCTYPFMEHAPHVF